jgi:hypothetical protein
VDAATTDAARADAATTEAGRTDARRADSIGAVVKRLARPHASGGTVVERSVILAEGASSGAILSWISDHDGIADFSVAAARGQGLHGSRINANAAPQTGPARRFVLPAGAFD